MRFALTDEQQALRQAAADVLTRHCPPEILRQAWEGKPDNTAWHALADLGALTAMVPLDKDGLGLDETHLVGVIIEAGKVSLPYPITETALVAAPLVGTPVPNAGMVFASNLGSPLVVGANLADGLLLDTQDTQSPTRLFYFNDGDYDLKPVVTIDRSRQSAKVTLKNDNLPLTNDSETYIQHEGTLITDDPDEITLTFNRGYLGTAAELIGLSHTMLNMTVDYVKQRHQFNKPVGSFQAVKHHLANARLKLEFAEPALLYAAYALANRQDDSNRATSTAKWLANATAALTGRVALQCHGAIGYTIESDLHLYLKRSWALIRCWGDSNFHQDRVRQALLS